jgi:integrase
VACLAGWLWSVVALVTAHLPGLGLDDLDLAGGALLWPGVHGAWARYREHLMGLDGARPLAASTITNYRKILWDWAAFLDPCVVAPDDQPGPCRPGAAAPGHRPWQRAGPHHLVAFLDRPAPHSRTGTRAANTRLQIAIAVRGLYRWAHRHGYTAKDRMVLFELPKGGQPRPRGFDQSELRQIILAAEDDARLYLIVWAAYAAGLRAAEIANLRIEQVDLRHGWLDVTGKGGKRRLVPIYPELRAALVRYLGGRPTAGPLICSERAPYGPLHPHTITVYVSQHIKAQPDPHHPGEYLTGSCHDLRHSLIWWLLESAGEQYLKTISLIAGHADTGVTEKVYGLKYSGRSKEVMDQLANPLHPSSKERP